MRSLQMFGVFLGHVQGMVAINYYISTQPKRNGQFQGNKPELLVRFQRLFEKKQKKMVKFGEWCGTGASLFSRVGSSWVMIQRHHRQTDHFTECFRGAQWLDRSPCMVSDSPPKPWYSPESANFGVLWQAGCLLWLTIISLV